MAWTRVEQDLGQTIASILGIKLVNGDQWGMSSNWLIYTVMQTAETNHARIKIVDAILQPALLGHDLLSSWTELMARLKKRARDRNVVVHTGWAWSEQHPTGVLRVTNNQFEIWVERDFLDAFDRIAALEHDLHRFMVAVIQAVQEGTLVSPILKPERINIDL